MVRSLSAMNQPVTKMTPFKLRMQCEPRKTTSRFELATFAFIVNLCLPFIESDSVMRENPGIALCRQKRE